MKKFQKLSAAAIALAMCLLLTVTAWAANSLGVTYEAALDDATLCFSDQKQTVTLTVKTNKTVEMDALTAEVKVPEGLQLTGIANNKLNFTEELNYNLENGSIMWYSLSAENVQTDLLAVVTITVPAGTPVGTYQIDFVIGDISKDYSKDIWESGATVSATLTISNHADGTDEDHNCDNCQKENVDGGHHGGTATCVAAAVCEECHQSYGNLNPDNHAKVVTDAAVAPDCTNTGLTEGSHCEACTKVLVAQEVVAALGHTEGETVVENNVDPDCDDTGSYDEVVYCTVCGEELSRDTVTVPALGHTGGETVVENNVDPDCVNDGSYDNVVYCTVCGEELSRDTVTVPALGHTEGEIVVENNVDPDCENDGSYDNVVYCTVCGEELSRDTVTVPALGHAWGEPVYKDNGDGTHTATYTCVHDANHTKSETNDHTYENGECVVCGAINDIAVVDKTNAKATHTVDGNVVTVTCSIACKVGYWSETDGKYIAIPAVANADGSYSFTAPEGVTEVLLVVKGDVSGDGKVNLADRLKLSKSLLSHNNDNYSPLEEAWQIFTADVTGDGKVNLADRLALSKSLLSANNANYKALSW